MFIVVQSLVRLVYPFCSADRNKGLMVGMDVSADLIELGRTAMGVICAGAKSILDIPRTLEVLETQGVCVASYGQKEFPAFYTPSSGAKVSL